MYNLFAELERQPQRIQPIIVRIITPITERWLSAAWGGRRGAELARVRSVTPGREARLAAVPLGIGFSGNAHGFKYGECMPPDAFLHLAHIHFVFCIYACLCDPHCD